MSTRATKRAAAAARAREIAPAVAFIDILSQCPACGGELMLLGTLGVLDHFRCRRCGTEVSAPVS